VYWFGTFLHMFLHMFGMLCQVKSGNPAAMLEKTEIMFEPLFSGKNRRNILITVSTSFASRFDETHETGQLAVSRLTFGKTFFLHNNANYAVRLHITTQLSYACR
jgi:hypothetical protein